MVLGLMIIVLVTARLPCTFILWRLGVTQEGGVKNHYFDMLGAAWLKKVSFAEGAWDVIYRSLNMARDVIYRSLN